ncbi:MAG: non-canonical purine NTP pyrophosphatase [Holophagaceae bacterium]|nr:non-canonical purine NTP pyrophosphatase [Holophagaceae bacterium]
MRILLASRNPGKLREFSGLLPDFTLLPWPTDAPEIPEDGAFFRDNAGQKASFACDWWQGNGAGSVDAVLADDSGLCVDALWGGPGVLSARFASGLPNDEKNRRLLAMLPPDAVRTARFVCVLAFMPMPSSVLRFFEASVEGSLAMEPRGQHGFGYDPIFMPDGFDQTFGELSNDVKASLSHRAKAAQALREALANLAMGR